MRGFSLQKGAKNMYANKEIITVKIQRAIFGNPAVLIYNKDRSYYMELPLDETFKKIIGESLKGYIKVRIENGKLTVIKPVCGLDW